MPFHSTIVSLTRSQKVFLILALDCMLIALSMAASFVIVAPGLAPDGASMISLYAFICVISWGASLALGLPGIRLNAYETSGLPRTGVLAVVLAGSGLALDGLVGSFLPVAYYIVLAMVFTISSVALRVVLRAIVTWAYRHEGKRRRVAIYGAGQTGQQLVAALKMDDVVQAVAFVDDNPTVHGTRLNGLTVYEPGKIEELVKSGKIEHVVMAMPSVNPVRQNKLADKVKAMGAQVQSLPSFARIVSNEANSAPEVRMSLDMLLGRSQLEHDLPEVRDVYEGRSILVTGAGGSIGSELCRQIVECKPARLILLDHSELALYDIHRELNEAAWRQGVELVAALGSVTDDPFIRRVYSRNDVDVVLHAAAYKHVPMVEDNEIAGAGNNVLGTRIAAEAARDLGVERFILVSSDKAVRPTSVMGATKRLAELVIQDLATRSENTLFSMVRFGNVLGSSGSVVPLFREQISRGGPVTVTHPEVTRYFMTKTEAARLVLVAGGFARGGDVFVLDMGAPHKVADLARRMIEGAGLNVRGPGAPDGEIEIIFTGLRPGEKLREELLISPDMLTTPHSKILRANETFLSEIEVAKVMRELRAAVDQQDANMLRNLITRWVEAAPKQETPQVI